MMFRTAKIVVAGLSLTTLVLAAPSFAVPASPTATKLDAPAAGGDMVTKQVGRLQKLLDQLELTDDQKTKVEPIMTQLKTDLQAVSDDAALDDDAKKEKMKTTVGDASKKITKDILTPEQQKKLKDLKAAAMSGAPAKGKKK